MSKRRLQPAEALRRLAEAKSSGRYARVVSHARADGYVVGLSTELAVVSVIDDRIRFDGYKLLPLSDVTEIHCPGPRAEFHETALQLLGEERPECPDIDLTSMTTALQTANRIFPLVSIHIRGDEEVCWIGRVMHCDDVTLTLEEIDCDARWTECANYAIEDICGVDFGGGYEHALWVVNQAAEDGRSS